MTDLERLRKIDPAKDFTVSDDVFEELRRHIITAGKSGEARVKWARRTRRTILGAGIAACAIVVTTFAVRGPSRPPQGQLTSWHVVDATAPLPFVPTSPQSAVQAGQSGLLTCPTENVCYLLSSAAGAKRPPFWTVAYVTTDGGQVWKTTAALPADATFTAPLTCSSASRCLAPGTLAGDALFSFASDPGPATPVVFTTVNGGLSWQTLALPASAGFITSLSCPSVATCVASSVVSAHHATPLSAAEAASLGGAIAERPTVASHLLRTSDGGRTWAVLKNPERGSFFDFECLDTTTCAGLGVPDHPTRAPLMAYVSNDGGTSWTARPLPGHLTRYAYGLACFGIDSCVAFDSNNISATSTFLSSDQGRSWATDRSPEGLPGVAIRSLSCSDISHCWGIAPDKGGSAILATTDSGLTWSIAATSTRLGSFTNIACVVGGACTALENTPQGTITLTNGGGD
jgi:photosystem II stability/assembly factor-like uncharacterized protein